MHFFYLTNYFYHRHLIQKNDDGILARSRFSPPTKKFAYRIKHTGNRDNRLANTTMDNNNNSNNHDVIENQGDVELTNISNGNDKINRHVFPKITKMVLDKGEHIKTYPFLERSCESELIFCRLLAIEKPFVAPHGGVGTAWKDFLSNVNGQRDENNKLVFNPPMTERYAKTRVNDYFSFVKEKDSQTPFNSGCDDEEAPCELLTLIEDLYEQKKSFESIATQKKNITVLHKHESESIRLGALGDYARSKKKQDDANYILNIDMGQDTPVPFAKRKESSSNSSGTKSINSARSNLDDSAKSLQELANKRHDIKAEKEKNKKLKYEVQLKLLDEKRAKREERSKRKAEERAEDKKEKEKDREQNKSVLDAVLLALHKKIDDK
jgi:hypothetical protein